MPELPPSPLHVAFYMHDLSCGGVERMRLLLMSALRDRGIRVTLIVGNSRGKLRSLVPPDLPLIDLKSGRTLGEIFKLRSYLKANSPDVLVSSLDHNNIAAMLARIWCGVPTRLVVCQHNALSSERCLGWKYRIVPLAYWLLQGSADAFIAVSRGVADDLVAAAGLSRRKVTVIYNPVVSAELAIRAQAPAPHPWFIGRTCPVFVFVGRLVAQKGVGTLIRAMQHLVRRKRAKLIVIGEGEQELVLRRAAVNRGVDHAVDFVGYQSNAVVWIKHADALVLPSQYEGLGNVIVEALACGTEVIATDCPHGPAEILLEGALGKLVPVGDSIALAKAMDERTGSCRNPQSLVDRASSFTADACAEAHLKVFGRLFTQRSRDTDALGMTLSGLKTKDIVHEIITDRRVPALRLLVTPNLDHLRLLERPRFADAYAYAYRVCPDGFPILLYGRLRGLRLRERVTGCDVLSLLLRDERMSSHRLLLVAESSESAMAAEEWASSKSVSQAVKVIVASLDLAACQRSQQEIVQEAALFCPTIIVMTLGAPVSEEFVYRYRLALPACWVLCVGQALRVELGLAKRAPRSARRVGLEWLWRVSQEPRRLGGRYVKAACWYPLAVLRDTLRRSTDTV